jgi:hypothetical protein
MRFKDKFGGKQARLEGQTEDETLDPMLEQALVEFRSSVLAWSDAAYQRSRTVLAASPRRQVWRLAAGWALGCALLAGGVSGGLNVRHHRQEMARIAAAHEAEQRRLVAEQRAREEEDLLAKVDSDVSREVPSAMEPLAQLMAEDETR